MNEKQAKEIVKGYPKGYKNEVGLRELIGKYGSKKQKKSVNFMPYPILRHHHRTLLGVAKKILNYEPKKQTPTVTQNINRPNPLLITPHRKIGGVEQTVLSFPF